MTRTVKNPFLNFYLKELCCNCQQKLGGVLFYEDKKAKCYIYTRVSTVRNEHCLGKTVDNRDVRRKK